MEKPCLQCKKEFEKNKNCSYKNWENVKFCSRPCYWKSLVKGSMEKCKNCPKEIWVFPWERNKGNFCSHKCYSDSNIGGTSWNKGTKGLKVNMDKGNCKICASEFSYYKSNYSTRETERLYCSVKCRKVGVGLWFRDNWTGDKNINWKGGVTPLNEKLRKSPAYKLWRKSVFERDSYTCQMCGQVGGEINADHIKEWALYEDLRFDLNNGRTLCVGCHRKYTNWGFKTVKLMEQTTI